MSGICITTFVTNYRILFYISQTKFFYARNKFLTLEIKSSIIELE
nr:MAG TPA: hypothetical protein [Caudoviricetes sp.]